MSYEAIRTGADPRKDTTIAGTTSTMWLTLQPNEAVNLICLVEKEAIIAIEQCAIWLDEGNSPVWVYTGEDDPSHDLKVDRRYRAYLPCLVKDESGERQPRVFSMGKSVHIALLDIADAVGSLAGVELRIKRTGSGLATRYSVAQTGKKMDISRVDEIDVIALLGPLDSDGVKDLICKKLEIPDYEDVVARYKGKGPKTGGKGKDGKKVSKTKVSKGEDEDLEDLELLP